MPVIDIIIDANSVKMLGRARAVIRENGRRRKGSEPGGASDMWHTDGPNETRKIKHVNICYTCSNFGR